MIRTATLAILASTALAAWCGLRFGELTALRRRDIDLIEGTITVTWDGLTATAPIATGPHDPTCVTTLQLS